MKGITFSKVKLICKTHESESHKSLEPLHQLHCNADRLDRYHRGRSAVAEYRTEASEKCLADKTEPKDSSPANHH